DLSNIDRSFIVSTCRGFYPTHMSRYLLAVLLVCACGYAQYDASVLGTVKDPQGLTVGAVSVTLSNIANGVQKTVVTDNNGNYEFLNVRIGEYTLKAEKAGFETGMSAQFTVTVNARQRVDISLNVASASEKVTVTSTAEMLETDSSDRGEVIASREIVN